MRSLFSRFAPRRKDPPPVEPPVETEPEPIETQATAVPPAAGIFITRRQIRGPLIVLIFNVLILIGLAAIALSVTPSVQIVQVPAPPPPLATRIPPPTPVPPTPLPPTPTPT